MGKPSPHASASNSGAHFGRAEYLVEEHVLGQAVPCQRSRWVDLADAHLGHTPTPGTLLAKTAFFIQFHNPSLIICVNHESLP